MVTKEYDIQSKGIVVACDVNTHEELQALVKNTISTGVSGYKLGYLSLKRGIEKEVNVILEQAYLAKRDVEIIYDHQKAGSDVPDTADKFAKQMRTAGVNTVILFAHSGPAVVYSFIKELQKAEVDVMFGAEMTHKFFYSDEGGWIDRERLDYAYGIAAGMGVTKFVVPGTKPNSVLRIRNLLEQPSKEYLESLNALMKEVSKGEWLYKPSVSPVTLYAPGFVAQGGKISDAGKVAGKRWRAIVGRAIYEQTGIDGQSNAAREYVESIRKE